MKSLLKLFLILGLVNYSAQSKLKKLTESLSKFLSNDACAQRERLISTNRKEEFKVVETAIGTNLTLACRFCDESDDPVPKLWYRQNRFRDNDITEVELGMDDNLESNRVYMKPDHSLVINKTIPEDAALYFCSGPHGEDKEFQFNYLVDILNATGAKVTFGTLEDWEKNGTAAYAEMNDKFKNSDRSDYAEIRSKGIQLQVIGRWQAWGICNGCQKIRARIAECHLQPSLKDKNVTFTDLLPDREAFLLKSFEMSCYSAEFSNFYPYISADLRNLENYAITEHCIAPCKVELRSNFSAHYRNTIVLTRGDSFTFPCPEVTLESIVVWKKNDETVSDNVKQGDVVVDSFSNLFILYASKDDEGNYTCYVDNVKMQELVIVVYEQSIFLSAAFFRHASYIGFVFVFSTILYIAGLILAWQKKDTFKKINFDKLAQQYATYQPVV